MNSSHGIQNLSARSCFTKHITFSPFRSTSSGCFTSTWLKSLGPARRMPALSPLSPFRVYILAVTICGHGSALCMRPLPRGRRLSFYIILSNWEITHNNDNFNGKSMVKQDTTLERTYKCWHAQFPRLSRSWCLTPSPSIFPNSARIGRYNMPLALEIAINVSFLFLLDSKQCVYELKASSKNPEFQKISE